MPALPKKPFKTVEDIEIFFEAYNRRDWDLLFSYMTEDCIWDASEKRMTGKQETLDYWMVCHSAISEKLGKPYNILITDDRVILEVLVRMDFITDGIFFGKPYKKGRSVEFLCADLYELQEDGLIREARIYVKFLNSSKKNYIKDPKYDIQ